MVFAGKNAYAQLLLISVHSFLNLNQVALKTNSLLQVSPKILERDDFSCLSLAGLLCLRLILLRCCGLSQSEIIDIFM